MTYRMDRVTCQTSLFELELPSTLELNQINHLSQRLRHRAIETTHIASINYHDAFVSERIILAISLLL